MIVSFHSQMCLLVFSSNGVFDTFIIPSPGSGLSPGIYYCNKQLLTVSNLNCIKSIQTEVPKYFSEHLQGLSDALIFCTTEYKII